MSSHPGSVNVNVPRRQHRISFPSEIIEKILVQAWISFERKIEHQGRKGRDYWQFYYNISLVSRQYRACMIWVSISYIYLVTPPDVTSYARLVQNHVTSPSGSSADQESTTISPRHVYVTGGIEACLTHGYYPTSQDNRLSKLLASLVRSPSLELDERVCGQHSIAWPLHWFPSITHLTMSGSIFVAEGNSTFRGTLPARMSPSDIFPSVTHLYIDDHSAYTSMNLYGLTEALHKFMSRFPRATHCRIFIHWSAVQLVGILPPNLEVLEFEAGSWLGGSSSSIRHLFIATAVRKGLFSERSPSSKRKIVVYTGKGDVDIWEPTLRTCTEYGVTLERMPILSDMSVGSQKDPSTSAAALDIGQRT